MDNKKLANQVSIILQDFSKMDKKKIPIDEKGNIKFPEFFEVDEVKQVCQELKELGATSKWLMANGFVAAGMLLRIK
jgi:hypothetical protein